MAIIEVKALTKVFGNDPKRAFSLLDQGWSKERIAKETKLTVGVNRVSFSIEPGEIFVIMGLIRKWQIYIGEIVKPTYRANMLDKCSLMVRILSRLNPEELTAS